MAVFAFFIFLIGLLHIFAPYVAWYLSIGWKIRDAEPSDAYLTATRVGGVIGCVVAVFLFISALGHS